MMETFQGGRVGTFCVTQITKMFYSSILSTVLAKGEMEPERKETRTKVDEDRKHEYPYRPYRCYNQGHLTLTIVASIS